MLATGRCVELLESVNIVKLKDIRKSHCKSMFVVKRMYVPNNWFLMVY